MGRDNIPGIAGSRAKRVFLLPGMILQWFMYVFVAGESYSVLRQNTRLARSPLMTWVFSAIIWVAFIYALWRVLYNYYAAAG